MEIIEHKWNKKYEYTESRLKTRETLKFKEAVEVLNILKKHTEMTYRFKITEVVYLANYYLDIIKIKTNRDVTYNFKFTDKQRLKINDLLVDLNNGKKVETVYV